MAVWQLGIPVARWIKHTKPGSRGSLAKLVAPVSRRYRPAASISALLMMCAAASWTSSTMATEPEPDYFTYHGQPKRLTLDPTRIAIRATSSGHASSRTSNIVSPSLASDGFADSDVVARPVSGWAILNTDNALNAVRAKAQSIGRSAPEPSRKTAIHALISSVLESRDPTVAFISPVFRDEDGGAILLSSRVLIGFNKDFGSAE